MKDTLTSFAAVVVMPVLSVALVLGLILLLDGCKTPPKCPPLPEETICCESCEAMDAGCGRTICKPYSGKNCGPCPRFAP